MVPRFACFFARRAFSQSIGKGGRSQRTANLTPSSFARKTPASSSHFNALESLASKIPEMPQLNLTKYLPTESQEEKATRVFSEGVKLLMQPEVWTYGAFLNYQRKMIDLLGGHTWRHKLTQQNDPNIEHLEKETRVLEAMTLPELRSNHYSVFDTESKKMIAEKANATVEFVDQVLMMHDAMRADRRWYKIRQQFGRRLPTDFADRQQMAEMDRPPSQLEKKDMRSRQKKMTEFSRNTKIPRIRGPYKRHPSCGGNQWSTQPPRWYPRWKSGDIPAHMRMNS